MLKPLLAGGALAAALLAGAALVPANAQDVPVTLTRGTIASLEGQTLEAKTRNGATIPVTLTDKSAVLGATNATIADVKPDSYIGVAAAPQPDGTLKALEVTIIDQKLRGMGDGHYGWDLTGGNTMTNGAVGSVQTANGRTLVINYKGGSKTITVPDDVPVVSIAPADRAVLKPGARIVVISDKGASGVTANAVIAGVNGTVPPM